MKEDSRNRVYVVVDFSTKEVSAFGNITAACAFLPGSSYSTVIRNIRSKGVYWNEGRSVSCVVIKRGGKSRA